MTMTDQIAEVLRIHGDSCTRGNARYLAEKIVAELNFREERIPVNDLIYEPGQSRWVSAWFPDA